MSLNHDWIHIVWCIDITYISTQHQSIQFPHNLLRRWNRPKPMLQLVGKILWKPPKWFSNSESERCWRVLGMFQGYVWKFLETPCRCWNILETGLKLQVGVEVKLWLQLVGKYWQTLSPKPKRICWTSLGWFFGLGSMDLVWSKYLRKSCQN